MAKRARRVKRAAGVRRARSVASRKGWATRRANIEARSRAARKGWATRRKDTGEWRDYLVTVNFQAGGAGGVHRYSRSMLVPAPVNAGRRDILTRAKREAPRAFRDLLNTSTWTKADIARGPRTRRKRTEER